MAVHARPLSTFLPLSSFRAASACSTDKSRGNPACFSEIPGHAVHSYDPGDPPVHSLSIPSRRHILRGSGVAVAAALLAGHRVLRAQDKARLSFAAVTFSEAG